ncbi:related to Probable guanine deaminase [Saccharomycodes ludwigii]|uniref:Guanine deaminase n=1 Tax=Saccharomycodes ludwigii TaxID=36035 RepID=A0A376B6R5_9ASCO|nr:hypothetical protein SCDLUD_003026 [Saccharomycodes ludwigii]KAH3901529.1 hypothetical protein SCDLUD_003026 [Saccharomycodes ludwigii]SSD60164.1 related to Probable guanine deaminase [Saccharomycodes ludwigii]
MTIKKLVLFCGTFVDTPELGTLRVRINTTIGVSLMIGNNNNHKKGEIKFIRENSPNYDINPILDALEYDPTLHTSEIEVINLQPGTDWLNGTRFYFPGFIDTHCHASQYPNSGIFGSSTLLDWLEKYTFPLEASLKEYKLAFNVYSKAVQRTITNGTTCCSYYATIDPNSTNLLADICNRLGQRAFIGKVCMDRNCPSYYKEHNVQECMDNMDIVLNHISDEIQNDRIKPIITPRFAPTCSQEMLTYLGELVKKHRLHVQTHLSENVEEVKWVLQLFPDCKTYTDVYQKFGLLSEKTVLAHCIHLSEPELKVLRETGSGVSHCPISNSSITSGECRVRWLLDNGIDVSLGTDISGGFSSSILNTARQAHLVSRHVAMKQKENKDYYKLNVNECLYIATMGGAKVLDLQDAIGSFDVGKQFDAQLVDLNTIGSNVDVFEWQLTDLNDRNNEKKNMELFHDIIAKWFFNGDRFNTARVWVSGQLIHSI